MSGHLYLTEAGKELLARHWDRWIATRLRDHANGLHADNPSGICPDCIRAAEAKEAS